MNDFQSDQFGRPRNVIMDSSPRTSKAAVAAAALSVIAFVPLVPAIGLIAGISAGKAIDRSPSLTGRGWARFAVACGLLLTLSQIAAGIIAFAPFGASIRQALAG